MISRSKKQTCVLVVACLIAIGSADSSKAVVLYQVDDGTAEDAIYGGPPSPAALWWVNGFTAQPGGELITHIEIAYGLPFVIPLAVNGFPVTILLYEDPNDDMDPTDAVLLTSVESTIQNANNDTFNSIAITPTVVNGEFFVGALVDKTGVDELGNPDWAGAPAASDSSSVRAGRSWLAENTNGLIDPSNVAATATQGPTLLDDTPLAGNLLIRAVGIPEHALPTGDFDEDGDVDGADFLYWQLNDGSESELDLWQATFGNVASSITAASTGVPEPTALLLLLLGLSAVGISRRRFRK